MTTGPSQGIGMTFDPDAFRHDVLRLLDAHARTFGRSREDHSLLRRQIERGDDIHSRRTFPGHITASAIVLDASRQRTLLIRHRAMNRWLQPGGHYEAPESLPDSALREAMEETGLQELALDPWHARSSLPIDIDTHRIAARPDRDEPEHFHHDIRYVILASEAAHLSPDFAEVEGAAWRDVSVLEHVMPQALSNMLNLGLARM